MGQGRAIVMERPMARGKSSMTIKAVLALLALAGGTAATGKTCDPVAFGAAANDRAADTTAIQRAIDACAGTGGTVLLGAGRWLTGGLTLKSDMTFRLAAGAVLAAIPDIALYPERFDASVSEGTTEAGDGYDRYRAILYAAGAKNLMIEGPGTLDGQGPGFWEPNFYALDIPRPLRPRPQQMIELIDCNNVKVRGLRMVDAPAYSLRFYRCTDVRAEDIYIRNDPRSPNTDGIQIRDTVNAFITRADIATGDDAVVVKSYKRLVDNLVVTDSVLQSDDSAIKFGTAGHVGVSNSRFANITIRASRFGIGLWQMDGGSYLNNRFNDIAIETGGRGTRQFAIFVDIDRRRAGGRLGRIEGLSFSDIDVTTRANILIGGQPDARIRDLTLTNVRVRTTAPSEVIDAKRRKPRGNAFVPLTGTTRDYASVPASVVIANAERVTIDGLDAVHADPKRGALALMDVSGADIAGLRVAGADTAVRLSNSADVTLRATGRLTDVETFLRVEDAHRGRLIIRDADLGGVATPWALPTGVRPVTSGVVR
jgi:hypothetical protein